MKSCLKAVNDTVNKHRSVKKPRIKKNSSQSIPVVSSYFHTFVVAKLEKIFGNR